MDKNVTEMSNTDIIVYKRELETEFEAVKKNIADLYDRLDSIDAAYRKADAELDRRKNFLN